MAEIAKTQGLPETERPQTITAALAVLAWSGVILSAANAMLSDVSTIGDVGRTLVHLSIFFTLWTNTAIALTLTVPLLWPDTRLGRFFKRPGVVTALAAAITLVSIAYELLLRPAGWHPLGIELIADALVHYIVPVSFLAYWWFVVPKVTLQWSDPLRWLWYFIVYTTYVLAQGTVTHSYPYPFVDVAEIGYQNAIVNAIGLWLIFLAISLLFIALGRVQLRRT